MKEEKQKVGQIRKKEIREVAKKIFLTKGFQSTTMEDVITEIGMSRGGVYYHYRSKVEILHDLMREGMAYRMAKMNSFMADYSSELGKEAIAEMLVDRMLDENELMSIYVMYLQAIKDNDELKELYSILKEETLHSAYGGDINGVKLGDFRWNTTDFILYFVNAIILGCEILEARNNFLKNRDFLIKVMMLYFDYYDEGKIK